MQGHATSSSSSVPSRVDSPTLLERVRTGSDGSDQDDHEGEGGEAGGRGPMTEEERAHVETRMVELLVHPAHSDVVPFKGEWCFWTDKNVKKVGNTYRRSSCASLFTWNIRFFYRIVIKRMHSVSRLVGLQHSLH